MPSEPDDLPDLDRDLPSGAVSVLRRIGEMARDADTGAYLVGGPVRDMFLGVDSADLDVAVDGDGVAFARRIAEKLGAVVTTHERFMTAKIALEDAGEIDIATTRSEVYPQPGALPQVTPASIEKDLARRDFSINAMAICLNPDRFGRLMDPFGGAADLDRRRVRALHDGSFRDDPTRIIRAARFAARLGFAVDPGTGRLVREAVKTRALDTITADRLRRELSLVFADANPGRAMAILANLKVLDHIVPGIRVARGFSKLLEQAGRLSSFVEKSPEWDLTVLGLLIMLRGTTRENLARVRQRLNIRGRAGTTLAHAPGLADLVKRTEKARRVSEVHGELEGAPFEVSLAALVLARTERVRRLIVEYLRAGRGARPILTGDDLIALGHPAGPGLRMIIEALVRAKLDGEIENRRQEEDYVRRNFPPPAGG